MTDYAALEGEIAALYRAGTTPKMVDVPALRFLMIDGHGDPNTSGDYKDAVQALFALSYSLKYAIKRSGGVDHKVAPLEGLWWAADMHSFADDKSAWDWTMMIRQPAELSADLLAQLVSEVKDKKGLPTVSAVRLETFTEGRAAQVLHIGPYAAEAPTIARLHAFIRDQCYSFDGRRQKHHEIYLGDPRRSTPERLRTIVRQPVVAP